MQIATYSAASGMRAIESQVNTITNNIANMRTTGFKKQRTNFQDLFYQTYRRAGTVTSSSGTRLPAGLDIGTGVTVASNPRVMSQGPVERTEKTYDLAIRGEGFFQIRTPDGGSAYTRDGSFELSDTGSLVTAEGYTLEPGISIPANATQVTISKTGIISATISGQDQSIQLGQISLQRFVNKGGLQAIGDNLFKETDASGTASAGNPGDLGIGTLIQGHLEQSNVEAVMEMTLLMASNRAYEMLSRVLGSIDELAKQTSSIGR